MPNPKLNSRERVDIYRDLFLLNDAFHFITQILDELGKKSIFKKRDLLEMRGLAQEIQLEINKALLNPLELAELNDWTRFGETRKMLEKKLRGAS